MVYERHFGKPDSVGQPYPDAVVVLAVSLITSLRKVVP
jgi:hypothetical protein